MGVKNIGVIGGSEWVTIGNHIRSMGYGFTNEGCRQHFQGLRRAQNKADSSNGGLTESVRKVDPTMNPITRRPGPGRGRPKKSSGSIDGQDPPPTPIDAQPVTNQEPAEPTHDPALTQHPPHQYEQQPSPHQPGHPQPQYQHQQPHLQQHPSQFPLQQAGQHPQYQAQQFPTPPQQPQHIVPQPMQAPQHTPGPETTQTGAPVAEPLPLESEDGEGEDDDGPPIKRQRMESEDDMGQHNSLEEDPVLALANANNGNGGSDFNHDDNEFNYGEA